MKHTHLPKTATSTRLKRWFKWLRIILLFAVLAVVCWYSYVLWLYNNAQQYTDWQEGMGISQEGEKYGYVNEQFKLVIAHSFVYASPFQDGRAIVAINYGDNKKYRLIDKTGAYMGEFYDEIGGLGEGLYRVRLGVPQSQVKDEMDYSWHLMDKDGNILNDNHYTLIDVYQDGMARACVVAACRFLDTTGKEVIEAAHVPNSDRIQSISNYSDGTLKHTLPDGAYFSEGLVWFQKNGRFGYMDKQGKTAIPNQFLSAKNFSGGLAVVRTEQGFGVIDKQGRFVVQPNTNFKGIKTYSGNRAIFSQGDYAGVLDNTGKIIVSANKKYRTIGDFQDGMATVVVQDSLYGLIDDTGREIIPPIYEHLGGEFVDGVVWGILPNTENEVLYLDKNHKVVRRDKAIAY
ncbi:MAG: WG repeat-containing protein [Moraxella sp.]|nr:WG repeat-containing protein [Moraxella sp.]